MINLVLSIYEFEDWSATWLSQSLHQKTFPQPRLYPITILSTNMNSLNQHQWFFLSTSTANENSHQHQLQPITMYIRVSHLHFFLDFHIVSGRDECTSHQGTKKYRSSMLYVHNFFLILTFVSYKHRTVTVGKEYTSEIGFEVMKVI